MLAPWFFPTAAFLFGAIVGSFLNVCIHRIPTGQSIVRPGSHCACGAPIAWYDNIPILSWLLLRGRARCCGRPFSVRYPAVELLTALLFLACWRLFPPAKAVCGMVLVSALICGTFTDLDHMIIPDAFTVGLGVVGVVLSFIVPALHGENSGLFVVDSARSGVASLQGLFVGSGLVLWIALVAEAVLKKEAMGFGDVKLVGAIGALTSLDFLGLGVPEGTPSLGELLAQGKNNLDAWWISLATFTVLVFTLVLLILVGDALRDALDPRKAVAEDAS